MHVQITKMPAELEGRLRGPLRRGLVEAQEYAAEEISDAVPERKGSMWYRSRSSRYGRVKDEDIQTSRPKYPEANVYGVFRARFVNDGTRPHIIPVRGRHGTKRKIRHPGARANPFFDRTVSSPSVQAEATAIVARKMREVL